MLQGSPRSEILSNLNKLNSLVHFASKYGHLINIGIPDSSIFSDKESCDTRKFVNDHLAVNKQPRQKFIDCPLKFSPNSSLFDPDELHFSKSGSEEFANSITETVLKLLVPIETNTEELGN